MSLAEKVRRPSRLRTAALALGAAVALTVGLAGSAQAALLTPLPYMGGGAAKQEMFQPFFDYDSNGCYPAAAVDASGRLNGGLNPSGALNGGCGRDHLGRANTYSRAKCDPGTGWCGIVYTLYFEKDQGNVVLDIEANFPLQDRGDRFRQTLNEAKPAGIGFNAWS